MIRRSSLDSMEWSPAELFDREGLPSFDISLFISLFAGDRVALLYGSTESDAFGNTVVQRSRRSVSDAWSPATPVAIPGNGEATKQSERFEDPHISYDGRTIWFAAERPGGHGDKDIWMSSRVRKIQSNEHLKSSQKRSTSAPPFAVTPLDADQAKAHQNAWADHLGIPLETTNSIGMKLIVIPPGEFMMGEPDAAVRTTVARPFRFGIHEVTQSQYETIMNNGFWKLADWAGTTGDNVAASFVSWIDATEFCRKLTEHERKARHITEDQEYRLPTAAEWEFACRAGTSTNYSFGDNISQLGDHAWYGANAWYQGNVKGEPSATNPIVGLISYAQETGLKKPNPFGLFDVHGNVAECCAELLKGDTLPERLDPESYPGGFVRFRGGTWKGAHQESQSFRHIGVAEKHRRGTLGFRVVLTLPVPGRVSSNE